MISTELAKLFFLLDICQQIRICIYPYNRVEDRIYERIEREVAIQEGAIKKRHCRGTEPFG